MRLSIYTDGGCSGNPGPGGWAYVITADGQPGLPLPAEPGETPPPSAPIAERWGAESNTTNNRMELMAVISALEALPPLILEQGPQNPERITLYTDSQYFQKGITQWIHQWKRNGWRTSGKEPVKNRDLWQRLDGLTGRYPLIWAWIKGHAGNEMNERCDRMTQEAIRSLR
jgi:ribonuclease HI